MTAALVQHSALYEGTVSHIRHSPRVHSFSYQVAMVLLDLDELPAVFAQSRWWSLEHRNLVTFCRRDYHGPPELPLKQSVQATVEQQCGMKLEGRVCMLTNLRHCGFIINPITCYYCYDTQDTLRAIVAEVTNTPWHERYHYVLTVDASGRVAIEFAKAMHVSPFMPMELRYHWRSSKPAEEVDLQMTLTNDGAHVFYASLQLQRQPLDARAMRRLLWQHPLMTVEVGIGIYWQALKLWLKRIPFHPHPRHLRTTNSPTDPAQTLDRSLS